MYLGIDQSLTSTGLVVLRDGGTMLVNIKPGKRTGAERLAYIRDGIKAHTGRILLAAMEGYSMGSINRPFDLGELGGVVRVLLHDAQIPFVVVPPTSLKKFVTGNGQASKEQVQTSIASKWGVDIAQNDIADAYGLAQVAKAVIEGTTNRRELEVVRSLATDLKLPKQRDTLGGM